MKKQNKRSNRKDILTKIKHEKLRAETRKIDAERLKIEFEREELKSFGWLRKFAIFGKPVLGAILALPIIWFYFNEIAIPLFQRENFRLARENEATRDSLFSARKKFEGEVSEFKTQI